MKNGFFFLTYFCLGFAIGLMVANIVTALTPTQISVTCQYKAPPPDLR